MKTFCFTVDDNVRFLKEIEQEELLSIFSHPYLAMYKRLHETFGLKVQLNLFYRMEGFELSQASSRYVSEFEENSDWLKLSFHSDLENVRPYEFSGYDEVFADCKKVNGEILRFAGASSLAKTTTVHYCRTTDEGLKALKDNGYVGLLGLFGDSEHPRTSYGLEEGIASQIRDGAIVKKDGVDFAAIDVILNRFSKEEIISQLDGLKERACLKVMIHEQYFYPDYKSYQPDFEKKLHATFSFLAELGYESKFFEELL